MAAVLIEPAAGAAGSAPARRRRPVLVAAAVVLVVLFAGIELMLLGAYRETGRVNVHFAKATDITTSLANAQREALLLRSEVALSDGRGRHGRLALYRATLARQLEVVRGQAGARSKLGWLIVGAESDLARFDALRRSARRRGSAGFMAAQGKMIRELDAAETRIKTAIDDAGHGLFGALSDTLRRGETRQALFAVGGALALLFGLMLTLILRRTIRSDFARANQALEAEVEERKALQEQLWQQATHDPLTGLGNRLHFQMRVDAALARFADGGEPVAVIYLDLDGFKEVNDGFGHEAGDGVLITTAERLGTALPAGAEVARLGGDEFAVLLVGPDANSAERVAGRLLEDLARPFSVRGQFVTLGGSAGLARGDVVHLEADDLLRDADLAMYAAKRAGKGGWRSFEPAMRMEVNARHELVGDLERALVKDDFRLHYQPVIDLHDGSLVGVEALVRWQHPDEGLLLPGRFLDAAEETGLITPLGDWVLDTACRQASAWHDAYGKHAPWVSVNISPRQLGREELVTEVATALAAHGTPPELLVLEISERVIATQARESTAMLERLRGLGVRLALDDFGAGQASLMQVRFLPLDILKLDRFFVESVDCDKDARTLAESVLHLAEGVGLATVAEGIETEAQLSALRALGFQMGQGFYSGRPAAPAGIDALLAAPPTGVVSRTPAASGSLLETLSTTG